MWKEFNNNPCGMRVGDCAIRAVSVALGIDWEDAYEMIARAEEKEDELHDIVDQLRSVVKDLPQPTQRAIQNFTDMVG